MLNFEGDPLMISYPHKNIKPIKTKTSYFWTSHHPSMEDIVRLSNSISLKFRILIKMIYHILITYLIVKNVHIERIELIIVKIFFSEGLD